MGFRLASLLRFYPIAKQEQNPISFKATACREKCFILLGLISNSDHNMVSRRPLSRKAPNAMLVKDKFLHYPRYETTHIMSILFRVEGTRGNATPL